MQEVHNDSGPLFEKKTGSKDSNPESDLNLVKVADEDDISLDLTAYTKKEVMQLKKVTRDLLTHYTKTLDEIPKEEKFNDVRMAFKLSLEQTVNDMKVIEDHIKKNENV